MKSFTVRDVLEATGGTFYGKAADLTRTVTAVSNDSRTIEPGTVYVAFRGARVDGHDYMAECLKKGACVCISERGPMDEREYPCIRVESSLKAYGALASWYRGLFDIPVIGITGSVGKTTTKEMIASVLSQKFRTHKTQKNFNNEIGVPRTLLSMPEDTEAAVVEMGISDFGEMTRLTEMVRPTIAVISMIGDAHLEFLGDRAGVLRAKTEIFKGMDPQNSLFVKNADDPYLANYKSPVWEITYGTQESDTVYIKRVENLGEQGMRVCICHDGQEFTAKISAYGLHMVNAAMAATAVGISLGMTDEQIVRGIESYETVGNRALILEGKSIRIVSDCYNANPNSTRAAIDSLMTLPGRHVCILGDMLELGKDTRQLHYDTGVYAVRCGIDLVIGCGELSESTVRGVRENGGIAYWYPDKPALAEKLGEWIRSGDTVLLKASHGMAFEDFIDALKLL